jgi:hypothetical protein
MTDDTPPRTAEQRQRLQQAMDAVAARFGPEAARMLCRMANDDRRPPSGFGLLMSTIERNYQRYYRGGTRD